MAPDTAKSDSVVFHCSMCGECCSGMTIPVTVQKAEALLSKPWVRERLAEFNRVLTRVDEHFYRMPLREDQYCLFLGEDKKCLIEVNEGPDLKPDECKRFPFARTDTTSGDSSYDVSSSCKTVAEELLVQFAPIVPAAGYEPSPQDLVLPDQIKVSGNKTIDHETYRQYCDNLWKIFAEASTPALALKQALALMTPLPDQPDQVPENAAFSNFWERWVPVWLLRKPYGLMSTVELVQNRNYHDAKIFGMPVELKDLEKISIDENASALLRAFLVSILNRRVLLIYGHSLETMLSMACGVYALCLWYARVLAKAQEKTTADKADMAPAIRLVERYYTGHQPRFPEKFRRHFFLKTLCRRVFC